MVAVVVDRDGVNEFVECYHSFADSVSFFILFSSWDLGSSPDSANTYSTYSGGGSGQGEFAPPPFTGDSSAYPATQ